MNLATFGMTFFLYLWICGFKICSLVFAEKVWFKNCLLKKRNVKFSSFILLSYFCVGMHVLPHTCEGQRTAFKSWLSLPRSWHWIQVFRFGSKSFYLLTISLGTDNPFYYNIMLTLVMMMSVPMPQNRGQRIALLSWFSSFIFTWFWGPNISHHTSVAITFTHWAIRLPPLPSFPIFFETLPALVVSVMDACLMIIT